MTDEEVFDRPAARHEEPPLTDDQRNALEIRLIEDYERKVELYGEDTDLWPTGLDEDEEAYDYEETQFDEMQETVTCWKCGGAGSFDLFEEDPLWYDADDQEECDECKGKGWLPIESDLPPPSP